MNRRELLKASLALPASVALGRYASAQSTTEFAPHRGAWRTFEVVTEINLPTTKDRSHAWVPLPSVETDWSNTISSTWSGNAESFDLVRGGQYDANILHIRWAGDVGAPTARVVNRVSTRDRSVDLSKPVNAPPLSEAERHLHLAATTLIPTDGIVKETADRITAGRNGDLEKVRAIYEWVVANTYRDAAVRGCGVGDVAAMLRSGTLGGKCADLNALFVGLARASGIPARDLYGIRVAPSRFGYKSLGASSQVITKAQHCRADVYLADFGWVPADPADVRKVVLEEPPGNLPIQDAKVQDARRTLFGAWEGNWMAYNVAHDVALKGSAQAPNGFLMYPEAEVAVERLDCLDPATFAYSITAQEIFA